MTRICALVLTTSLAVGFCWADGPAYPAMGSIEHAKIPHFDKLVPAGTRSSG